MFLRTGDQALFEQTTAQFLAPRYPSQRVRELAKQPSTFDGSVWKQGAELGWTSLLVPEEAGGGSVSDNGLHDLMIVAYQFGRHAAAGPLFGSNLAAFALGRWGTGEQREGPLARLLAGTATAAWASQPTVDALTAGKAPVDAVASGAGVRLNGGLTWCDATRDIDYLLVPAGVSLPKSLYLVATSTPGVQLVPLEGIDPTRRFSRVAFRDVAVSDADRVGELGHARAQEAVLLDHMAVLQSAEIVGAMDRAFEMTLAWTFDRYSFGRPLASYQEIKHRVADLRTQLEASAAVTARAARAVGLQSADASSWACAAKAYTGEYGPELIQDCIQLHGGIGVTFEHDLHLYLRRAAVNGQLFGTPEQFNRRMALLTAAETGAA
jgi:alkylation response protein AidB-like acyl-CoA dehydrogenase